MVDLKRVWDYRASAVIALLLLMVFVFFVHYGLVDDPRVFTLHFSTIPKIILEAWKIVTGGDARIDDFVWFRSLATAVFLHGDLRHLGTNALFFWIFGYLVESYLGKWRFVVVVLLTGILGNIAQVLLNPESVVPIIGASGAVTGLEGFYFALSVRYVLPDPHVWPIARPIAPAQLAIFAILGVVMDVGGMTSGAGGIAYGAHVGGFFAGLFLGVAAPNFFAAPRRHCQV